LNIYHPHSQFKSSEWQAVAISSCHAQIRSSRHHILCRCSTNVE